MQWQQGPDAIRAVAIQFREAFSALSMMTTSIWPLCACQFEPELFLYRGKDGWNRSGQLFPPLNRRGFTSQRGGLGAFECGRLMLG
jgi:hypothetical protein